MRIPLSPFGWRSRGAQATHPGSGDAHSSVPMWFLKCVALFAVQVPGLWRCWPCMSPRSWPTNVSSDACALVHKFSPRLRDARMARAHVRGHMCAPTCGWNNAPGQWNSGPAYSVECTKFSPKRSASRAVNSSPCKRNAGLFPFFSKTAKPKQPPHVTARDVVEG